MKSLLLSLLAVAGLVTTPAWAQDTTSVWAKPRLDNSPRHLEWVMVKHEDPAPTAPATSPAAADKAVAAPGHDTREVKSFIGYPAAKGKVPAVLVIHEIFGMSDWVRGTVDEFAEAGYIAIAPDLLWGSGPGGGGTESLGGADGARGKISSLPADQITADLKAEVAYLLKDPACDGQIFVVGFCWGGGQSFRFATNTKAVKAAFVFYGTPLPAADAITRIAAPVYGFFGETDSRVTMAVAPEAALMKTAGKTFEPVTYAGAAHGFMRLGEDTTADATKNAANKKARDDSWKRMLDLMKTISSTSASSSPGPTTDKMPATSPAPAK